ALLVAATARDRSLRVVTSRMVTVGGAKGVELVANERLSSHPREVRSTHLYAHGAELVVDAYAPPSQFARVDRTVFRPLLRSLGPGKDSATGHWELMGVVTPAPLPTYPAGFPPEVVARVRELTGRGVLANRPLNGLEAIERFGAEHLRTGDLIVYTSADSVLQ